MYVIFRLIPEVSGKLTKILISDRVFQTSCCHKYTLYLMKITFEELFIKKLYDT